MLSTWAAKKSHSSLSMNQVQPTPSRSQPLTVGTVIFWRFIFTSKLFPCRSIVKVTLVPASPVMRRTACSSVSSRGGSSRTASSEPEARMLVSCLVLQTLTFMSCSREFSPTTMPAYTSVPGSMKKTERSCSFHMP